MHYTQWSRKVGPCIDRGFVFLIQFGINENGKRNHTPFFHLPHSTRNVINVLQTYARNMFKALRYTTHCQGITQFYLHTVRFIRKRNEPYLPLAFPAAAGSHLLTRRDGRLSRPWCEVAPAEIRTCNLPITRRALYHTATSWIKAHILEAVKSYG